MKKKIIAGNWKMNKNFKEGSDLLNECIELLQNKNLDNVQVVFATPFIHLRKAFKDLKKIKHFSLAAQNCFWEDNGAYTGEISAPMIKSTGAEYVIIGHSERRQYFNETNEQLAKKVDAALRNNLIPIFCVGEILKIREENRHFTHVELQVVEGLFHLTEENFKKVVIAYEPVWAIGTGVNATSQQAQEMHAFIRRAVTEQYSKETGLQIPILYGGSVKPSNAHELFSQPDVDGGLIGGASLVAHDFSAIVEAAI
jgi:triosephosphate isomerase (TIM)